MTVRNSHIYNIIPVNPPSLWPAPGVSILLSVGDSNQAYNNVVHDTPGGGIATGLGATNTKIYNNTVYNGGGIGVGAASGVQIINNIAANNAGYGINVGAGGNDAASVNTAVQCNLTNGNGLGGIQNTGSNTLISNNLTGNPLFVDAPNWNFRLQTGSPAIGTGVPLTNIPPYNMDGTSRTQALGWDMGAY